MPAARTALAHLPRRFHEPHELRWGEHAASGGARLRWCALAARAPIAHCIVVGGFSECAEKYFETIADLVARNASVWFLEWRGQGASARSGSLRRQRPDARHYDEDAADLSGFASSVPGAGRPRVVIGHSMGAAIALLAMHDRPDVFDAAVLSAPMLRVRTAGIPHPVARGIAAAAVGLRLGHALVPGTRVWPADPFRTPEQSRTSSDSHRCRVQPSWFAERPELRIDGITYAWIRAALALGRRFEDPRLYAGIAAPVLMASAGRDTFVDVAAHAAAAAKLAICRHVVYESARHDIFMEADHIRDRWLAEIEAFLRAASAAGAAR